jgi:hypothetical protein
MAETLASHDRQRPSRSSTACGFVFGGAVGGNGGWVRLVVAVNTLLGPEKTIHACLMPFGVSGGGVFLGRSPSGRIAASRVGLCWMSGVFWSFGCSGSGFVGCVCCGGGGGWLCVC